jgi:hypothetical protein
MITRFLTGLHIFIGIGAVAGGSAAVLNPMNPLGMPISALEHAPFSTFLIPGLFLIFGIGITNLIAAGAIMLWPKGWFYVSGTAGGILIAWIVIQCLMLQAVVILHIIFGGFGVLITSLALVEAIRRRAFPLNRLLR